MNLAKEIAWNYQMKQNFLRHAVNYEVKGIGLIQETVSLFSFIQFLCEKLNVLILQPPKN